ncbi:UNVERIFIED_CONTAM: Spastin [Sesamum calycinum]|uniref:Spastin n=1 Tax=Sesamum calycinum TaxID=2727403 RepID=A0AAW2MK34_9LAMI
MGNGNSNRVLMVDPQFAVDEECEDQVKPLISVHFKVRASMVANLRMERAASWYYLYGQGGSQRKAIFEEKVKLERSWNKFISTLLSSVYGYKVLYGSDFKANNFTVLSNNGTGNQLINVPSPANSPFIFTSSPAIRPVTAHILRPRATPGPLGPELQQRITSQNQANQQRPRLQQLQQLALQPQQHQQPVQQVQQQHKVQTNKRKLQHVRHRVILTGPAGSEIYQETLAMALAQHYGVKLLVLDCQRNLSPMSDDVLKFHLHPALLKHLRSPKNQSRSMNMPSFPKATSESSVSQTALHPLYEKSQNQTVEIGNRVIFTGLKYGSVSTNIASSILYGLENLQAVQARKNSPKDIATDNDFEKRILEDVILHNQIGVKFDDIGALDKIKDAMKEVVILPLQRPELFCKGQLRKPCRGILLFGPPGTGKTMLAKAVAAEAGANLLNISTASITSKWYGDSEKFVKAIFSLASKLAPSLVFIDEVDSLLGKRRELEHEITRKVKNEFMLNWDGLHTKEMERVFILAATNRPFDLDEAVLRRMPRRFMVHLPDFPNRSKILKVILGKEDLSRDVDFNAIAHMTDGFSGSDLKNLCRAAAYRPVREILETDKQKSPQGAEKRHGEIRPLKMEDFKHACDQIRASVSNESRSLGEMLRWNEMYGEGGSNKNATLSYYI